MRISPLTLAAVVACFGVANAWVPTSVPANSRNTITSSSLMQRHATLDGKEIRGPLTPLGNFCLVKTKDTLSSSEGGILIPDQAKERPTEGQIIAAGPGKLHPHTGIRIVNPVTTGDSVLYGKFDGVQLLYNDDQCQMIRDDDVMLFYQGASMTIDSVQPCRDYVLIELEADATETASGIVVAAAVMRDQVPCEGIVKKVGEGRMTSKGELATPPVKPGDRVKFKDYAGNDVTIENKAFSLVRMVDILCTVEK